MELHWEGCATNWATPSSFNMHRSEHLILPKAMALTKLLILGLNNTGLLKTLPYCNSNYTVHIRLFLGMCCNYRDADLFVFRQSSGIVLPVLIPHQRP